MSTTATVGKIAIATIRTGAIRMHRAARIAARIAVVVAAVVVVRHPVGGTTGAEPYSDDVMQGSGPRVGMQWTCSGHAVGMQGQHVPGCLRLTSPVRGVNIGMTDSTIDWCARSILRTTLLPDLPVPNTCISWYNKLVAKSDLKARAAIVKEMRVASEGRSTGAGAPAGHSGIHSMSHDTGDRTAISFDALMGGGGGVDLAKGKHGVFVQPTDIDKVLGVMLSSKVAKHMFTQLDGNGVVAKMTAYVPVSDRKPVMATGAAVGGAEREVGGVVSGGKQNESVGMFIYFKLANKGAAEYLHLQTCFPIADADIGISSDGARVVITGQAAGGGGGAGITTTYKFDWIGSDAPKP